MKFLQFSPLRLAYGWTQELSLESRDLSSRPARVNQAMYCEEC